MRALLLCKAPLFLLVATVTSGCNIYYESKAEDMVERHMQAMVHVEGGEFMMGNPGGWSVRSDTIPVHRVVLDDFYIQKYEVTQGDFELFMAVTNYESSHDRYEAKRDENPDRYASELPAVASWKDATAFCQWLGKQTGKIITLPTEAQWEYAARARGKMLRYATHNGEAIPDETLAAGPSPYTQEYEPQGDMLPLKPGSFPPNPLGLHDMSGNVAEWVNDFYREDYYEKSPVQNPKGPESGREGLKEGHEARVFRGGYYTEFAGNTTVTRQGGSQAYSSYIVGFRCAAQEAD
ncbi:SUMF1/EgtB/PvdO family nonheme iron enzyme [Marinobacter sp. TBZ242]|uniref:SUMF1/EgtB/PvdO family nonheme iron enzyme n=1 Tax=Marinobacter azerbaijanicus TaxID=3050455 RepID=A0ABT7IJM0_9GAMM|nr:SUMF1/EgtB/PvdO family nonheme iron enzyme [Marinobacter sp. TBZ242]MDL0433353.1 SUMF1/EgtB/PvdO family nonheme iron enzyme [Marinobacter sp. TBZ242]